MFGWLTASFGFFLFLPVGLVVVPAVVAFFALPAWFFMGDDYRDRP